MAEPPDLTQFRIFVRNVMRIPTSALPDSAPVIQHTFDQALCIVNEDLGLGPSRPTSWSQYELAVYNLGGHLIVEFAPDVSYSLSAMSWASGLATATTTAPHEVLPGDKLTITAVSPLGYSGLPNGGGVLVTNVPDTTHFAYPIRNPGPAVLLVGAAATDQYFANARKQLKLNSFFPGVVASANDVSTGVGLQLPGFMQNLTLEDLQLLKTPYGRAYLAIAQKYGPNAWGLT